MKTQKLVLIIACTTLALALSGFNVSQRAMYNPENLADFHWKNRLLLINTDKQPSINAFMRDLDYTSTTERKLVVYALVNKTAFQILPNGVMKRASTLDKELNTLLEKKEQAYLIGLDGGIKATYPISSLSFEEVINRIDGMPMRQAELQ